MIYAVILSGGLGLRFWPKSRKNLPKQFLKVLGEKTMIENTVERITNIIPNDRICIVTNNIYVEKINEILKIKSSNIFKEPLNKETASCIGLAAIKLLKRDFEATMVVLPSDHVIEGQEEFERAIIKAIDVAQDGDYLVTFGINPTRPESGYGYIEVGDTIEDGVYKVKRFIEKPNVDVAASFIEKGNFLWNSGMFVWRADPRLTKVRLKRYLFIYFSIMVKLYKRYLICRIV